MRKMMLWIICTMVVCVTASCSKDWEEEQNNWASHQIGGVWVSPNTEGALMPDGNTAETFVLSTKVYDSRGTATQYVVARVRGEQAYVEDYGTISHPNGEPNDVMSIRSKKKNTEQIVTMVWGNSAHTQFDFGGRTWTKTDDEPWTIDYLPNTKFSGTVTQ